MFVVFIDVTKAFTPENHDILPKVLTKSLKLSFPLLFILVILE